MEKRLLLALALSTVILLAWSLFAPSPPKPTEPPPATPAAQNGGATDPHAPTAATAPHADLPIVGEPVGAKEPAELTLNIGTPGKRGSYLARFTNRGARLLELRLGDSFDAVGLNAIEKATPEHWTKLLIPADANLPSGSLAWRSDASSRDLEREPLDRALWSMRELAANEGGPGVEFALAQGAGVRFVKRVRFEPDTYRIHVELALENQALDAARKVGFLFTPAEVVPPEAQDKFYVEPQAVAAGRSDVAVAEKRPATAAIVRREDTPKALNGSFEIPQAEISFAGVHNKYFAVLARGADANAVRSIQSARWWRARDEVFARENPAQTDKAWHFVAADLVLQLDLPPRGETKRYEYVIYAGPKIADELAHESPDFEVLHNKDLGTFLGIDMSGIGNVMLAVLGFFHSVTGNWGVAIILLTLCVRALLFPLNRRSQTTMARYSKKMKRVQPQLDEVKKKYENDADKLRKAQAEIMQREGLVPPLGGCLPMFVQLPVFVGLFSSLRASFDLRHAPFFGWITDLSKPDRLLRIDWQLPLLGSIPYLNLLPILMVVLWLGQQMTMPTPTDEQAAKMQKMMRFMPVVFGLFLYEYAAGLSLYMITQSLLGIFEQTVVKKIWPIDDTERVKKNDGWLSRIQKRAVEMQKQQEARKRRLAGSGRGSKKR